MTLSFAPDRIAMWPLAKLQPYARNAKAHGADQVAKIAASMAEFGWTVPCLVAEDGELIAGHGRVLVVDGGGDTAHALLGDLVAAAAVANGWAGVVIHGCVRDVEAVAGMALGVAALGSCPRKTDKQGLGEVDVVLQFGGARIVPGQWIFVDASGVVVLDEHQATAALAEATGATV